MAIYQVLHAVTVVSFFERYAICGVLRLQAVEDQQRCMCVCIHLCIAISQAGITTSRLTSTPMEHVAHDCSVLYL